MSESINDNSESEGVPDSQRVDKEPEIARSNMLLTIEDLLGNSTSILFLEGLDGTGKTTLLKQFKREHEQTTFALFVSSASRWSYDPSTALSELCEEIERVLGVQVTDTTDERRFARLLRVATRTARQRNEQFFFILDGIEEIPDEDRTTRNELFALLPLGFSEFRFIVSGSSQMFAMPAAGQRTSKSLLVPSFTADEVARYFAATSFSDSELNEIRRVTKGFPGHLASIRRLLMSGISTTTIVSRLDRSLPVLFELEWQNLPDEPNLATLLGIVSYENRSYSVDQLADIGRLPNEDVRRALAGVSFVDIDPTGVVRFVSDSFRRFAAERLRHLRAGITELFIEYWQERSDEDEALIRLPNYLESADRWVDLVSYLSPERFASLYRRSPSIALVEQKAAQGIEAARRLNRDADVVRFTLQQSTVVELAESDATRSEVRALTALGSYEDAIAIAESEMRPVERLRLLIAIARVRKEHEKADDESLLARIRDIYSRLDESELNENAADLASDLFYTFPDLAIELVSNAGKPNDKDNARDWALVQLSVQAQLAGEDVIAKQRARDIRARIEDPAARKLSTEAMMVLGKLSGAEAIVEAKKLESTADQLYMLEHWMLANSRAADALDVLDEGLQIAVAATGYSANAGIYRSLASCLPHVPDIQRLSYYVGRIDAQKANLERTGPREEFIQLQLTLARAEWRFEKDLARKRYIDVYNTVNTITDLTVRAAATARLISALTRMDPDKELESDGLHSFAESDFDLAVSTLLSGSAEQFEALKGVIDALARVRPDLLIDLIPKLNTETRRDKAYARFAREAARSRPKPDRQLLLRVANLIQDDGDRDKVILNIARWVAGSGKELDSADMTINLGLVRLVRRASFRASVAGTLLSRLDPIGAALENSTSTYQSDLVLELKNAWEKLDADWMKLDVGYSIIADIARTHLDLATDLAADLDSLKKQFTLHTAESSKAAFLGLLLAIRCYAAMSARGLATPNDPERLRIAIERIGSGAEQAELWAALALRHFLHDNTEACTKCVEEYLIPQLDSLKSLDSSIHAEFLVRAAPAIYCGSRPHFDLVVLGLPEGQKEEAVFNTIWFLFQRTLPGDNYRSRPRSGYPIDYQIALAIIQLAEHLEADDAVYGSILGIVDSVASTANSFAFKQAQRDDLAQKLEILAKSKFPTKRFIRHEGYLVAARSQIARLHRKGDKTLEDALVANARNLPNSADRAYVLAILASTMRDASRRQPLITEIVKTISELPFLDDRIDRYDLAATNLGDVDPNVARRFLKEALALTFQGAGKSMEERRSDIIDRAYRIDKDFASSLASITGDEAATKRLERDVSLFKVKDALGHRKLTHDDPSPTDASQCSKAAWWLLGELNANRAQAIPIGRTLEYMRYAAIQPVGAAYPIFAWAIENAIRRAESDKAVRPLLVSLFEACLRGAELAGYAAMRPGASRATMSLHPNSTVPSVSLGKATLIKEGQRDEALKKIREWLIEAAPRELFIVDPYFTPDDVPILQLVQAVAEECSIFVLTDKRNHDKQVQAPYDDAYRGAWRRLSAQEPPTVTIILAGTASGKFPTHDRWWLTDGHGGIYMGTSLGGLGKRWSEVRFDDPVTASHMLTELSSLFNQSKKEFDGERVNYSTIRL